jgi:hypothetical protein
MAINYGDYGAVLMERSSSPPSDLAQDVVKKKKRKKNRNGYSTSVLTNKLKGY